MLGIILATGVLSGNVARLLKVPDVVLFLLAGMALGNARLGFIDINVTPRLTNYC